MTIRRYPTKEISNAIHKSVEHLIKHQKVMISVSGGSDSDVMIDIILRAIEDNNYLKEDLDLHFVFFDTGIEYEATKRHLNYLESKYNIKIERIRAITPVPLGCKRYGVPFLTKFVSEMIERLQDNNFDFENDGNKSFEELMLKYPKNKSALMWWCDGYNRDGYSSSSSRFSISAMPYLKEFMIQNPPNFKISNKCCQGAKKDNAKIYNEKNNIEMQCIGVRKAEGGIRQTAYKNCFSEKTDNLVAQFRPLFWFSNEDKKIYDKKYNIKHSDCYEVWGFKRTGCAACPFGSGFNKELEVIKKYEPKLYNACINIFGNSYKYTNDYKNFKEKMKSINKNIKKQCKGQISIDDLL